MQWKLGLDGEAVVYMMFFRASDIPSFFVGHRTLEALLITFFFFSFLFNGSLRHLHGYPLSIFFSSMEQKRGIGSAVE